MRLKSLYLKIFLSFLGILILTEILIMALFVFGAGRHFKEKFEGYTVAKAEMAGLYLENLIGDGGGGPPAVEDLSRPLARIGEIYKARLWIEDEAGVLVAKSFAGELPAKDSFCRGLPVSRTDRVELRKNRRLPWEFYAQGPLTLPGGRPGKLHIVFRAPPSPGHEGAFLLGLIVIGAMVALLTLPVSRLITRPVNRLRRSAVRIADGELSHRALVDSRDEIGQLSRAFNHMADRLEEMIRGGKELTANVSHELRSPLARIRVAEELIRRKADQEGCQGLATHLDDIKEDIEEQDRIIERIMILSKMDLSEEPLRMMELDPVELVEEVLERFAPLIRHRGLELVTRFDRPGPVFLDSQALAAAVSNLVDNAVKFTPQGGRVEVGVYRQGSNLALSFSNTLAGPPPLSLEEIFEPFHKSERSAGGGTGLGLAIVRKIAAKHGGRVGADYGAGIFSVRMELPLSG